MTHKGEETAHSMRKMMAVHRTIVVAAANGQIVTATRPSDRGTYNHLPREDWNSELCNHRFILCQMNPNQPFELDVPLSKSSREARHGFANSIAGERVDFCFLPEPSSIRWFAQRPSKAEEVARNSQLYG